MFSVSPAFIGTIVLQSATVSLAPTYGIDGVGIREDGKPISITAAEQQTSTALVQGPLSTSYSEESSDRASTSEVVESGTMQSIRGLIFCVPSIDLARSISLLFMGGERRTHCFTVAVILEMRTPIVAVNGSSPISRV